MVKKGKTIIRYRTRKVRTRHTPKTHSILGTFFGGMALATPFIHPMSNGLSPIDYLMDTARDYRYRIHWFTANLQVNIMNTWPKMLGYALSGALVSWLGKKYVKDNTQISKHWRII
jgi:hypothetical protein